MQRTLSIIKPDAVAKGVIGPIISRFEEEGFRVCAAKMIHMSRPQAEGFYAVHRERPFFKSLVEFMTSGPSFVMVLEREDAVKRNRELMGPTNPADAPEGTLRKLFATNVERNAVHGSDSPENAAIEIAHFFSAIERF